MAKLQLGRKRKHRRESISTDSTDYTDKWEKQEGNGLGGTQTESTEGTGSNNHATPLEFLGAEVDEESNMQAGCLEVFGFC
jgi:hypothetical protein